MKSTLITAMMMLASAGAMAADMVSPEQAATIRAAFPSTKIDSIRLSEVPGLLEVGMGNKVAYVSPGLPYLVVGHIYDTRTGKDLTADRLAEFQPKVSWDRLPLADAIQRGEGKKQIAILTDPDCPYCRKLEGELSKLEDVKVHIFMNPVPSLHPKAYAKTKAVWCSPDRLKAWDRAIAGEEVNSEDCDASAVDRNMKLAADLGFRGTPVIIREDGQVIKGMKPAQALAGWLGIPWTEKISTNMPGKPQKGSGK